MVAAAILKPAIETTIDRSALVDRMEQARARIEERFLEGGASLLAILDVLNKLVASLDQVTNSLDEGTARATVMELETTVSRLSQLKDIENSRRTQFQDIAASERNLRPHIADMLETLRYLRTFAVTAKITGASIPDFSAFAEEILARIQDGTRQVDTFAEKSASLGRGLGSIMGQGDAIIRNFEVTIPNIVTELAAGGKSIDSHRKLLGERAAKVSTVARTIQGKLASTLSAMQIGDITRQRIEHCQAALTITEDYLASPEASGLGMAQKDSLSALVHELVCAQLHDTMDDFDRDTAKIVANVSGFRSDLRAIEAVRIEMSGGEQDAAGSGDSAIRMLENAVTSAKNAVGDVETVAQVGAELARSTGRTVGELVQGINMIQLVRTDIHYMALNTNLRCSKIGDEGRAINVVTAELRNFAGQLDETSDKVLAELGSLEKTAQILNQIEEDAAGGPLSERLERAVQNIRNVGNRMDEQMSSLGAQSSLAVSSIETSLAGLDFQAELGAVLRACATDMAAARQDIALASGTETALAAIGGKIAATYTMVSERHIHASIFGTEIAAEPAPALSLVMSDDDIDDALF